MIEVELTDTEYHICRMIGQIRNIQTSRLCAEQIQSSLDPVLISEDGVMSEYIIAKHKKWFFDLNCEVRKFGADLITPTGHKIDVKSTRRIGGDMNVRITHKDKDYDYYVLVELKEQSGIIVGIAPRSVVIDDSNICVGSITGEKYYKVSRAKLKVWN
jgi:hypothetical protein